VTAVLVPTATEAEWLEARRKGVTASEIAVILGLSPWSSPYALYHRKAGTLPEQDDSDAMALGRYLESFVADQFAARHPEFYLGGDGHALYAHPERPWQMATPDRLIHEDGTGYLRFPPALAVLECKTSAAYDGWGDDGTDEIPVHYRCQVLWQMDVLGVTAGYVACLFLHSRQLRVYELTMDDQARADLKLMREHAELFLTRLPNDHFGGHPPDVDWRPATGDALKRLHPDVEDTDVPVRRMPIIQYQAACRAYRAAEQRKKAAENRLRQLLGNGRRITSIHTGEVIATRQVYDLAPRTIERSACTVDKLVPAKERTP
jgi:putative phage-type endonuclease